MDVGIVGRRAHVRTIAVQLLGKTAHNIICYDPEGQDTEPGCERCNNAAALFDRCTLVLLALNGDRELLSLLEAVREFVQPGLIVIDFTPISPALAHKISNRMRLLEARYLDCGVFSRNGQCTPPFLCFLAGHGETAARVMPLVRCIQPRCSYVGPAGRGQAMRLLACSMAVRIERQEREAAALAGKLGIAEEGFYEAMRGFQEIANPLAAVEGGKSPMPRDMLEAADRVIEEMERRARRF